MDQETGSAGQANVLTPSVPWDIGIRSQRQRILEAIAQSCAEKTFSTTTIADIVGHASISRATFYKHFANKRDCFETAADVFLMELQGAAANAYSSEDAPTDGIRKVTTAVLARLTAKPAYANLLLVEAPNVDPEIVRRYRDLVIKGLETQLPVERNGDRVGADPEIAFGRAKVLIADHLAAGEVDQLPSLLPELVYITLLPYLGQDKALEQAKLGR